MATTTDVVMAKAPLLAVAGHARALVEFESLKQHHERLTLAQSRLAELETLRAKARKPRIPAKIEPLPSTKRRREA